jgi:imidazoleglycerol-phosphate dehydratase
MQKRSLPAHPVGAHRIAKIQRKTNETDVSVALNLDGNGSAEVSTGIGFYDHMLHHLAHHGLFDLTIKATGDLHIDEHHTTEDVAIALGQAIDKALGGRAGIVRMADAWVTMDEALAQVIVDLSGRPYCVFQSEFETPRVGELSTSLIPHIFETISVHGRMNLHARVLYGRDDHHKAEALFKALGRALDAATLIDSRRVGRVPSTKGVI